MHWYWLIYEYINVSIVFVSASLKRMARMIRMTRIARMAEWQEQRRNAKRMTIMTRITVNKERKNGKRDENIDE